jgi:ABC-2 type transport system permease protein
VRAVRAIAGVELRRFLRDRSNIFFVFIFPLLLVLVLGVQFGGDDDGTVAVAGDRSALRTALVTALEEDGVAVSSGGAGTVREQVARGRTDVGVLLSEAATAAYDAGAGLQIEVIPSAEQGAQATMERVRTAAARVALEQGQVAALTAQGIGRPQAAAALNAASVTLTPPRLEVVDVDEVAQEFEGLGQFDQGAMAETLLFVFLASLAGSATLIQSRRLGVLRRTLAAPVSAGQAILGQVMGRFAIAGFQGAYIMVATMTLFGVSWGSVWLALVVLAAFSMVAAGAAMLIGSLLDNDGAASSAGVGVGLVLAALGGCMLPLELFPDTLQTVAHVTPHAWAYEALAEVQRHDAGIGDIAPQLAVLAGMAGGLLVLGTWALRRSMTRAI